MKLMNLLGEIDFKTIYATDFLRTRNTVKPLAESKNKAIKIYDAHDKNFILETLSEKQR